jgi:hypothetical protein
MCYTIHTFSGTVLSQLNPNSVTYFMARIPQPHSFHPFFSHKMTVKYTVRLITSHPLLFTGIDCPLGYHFQTVSYNFIPCPQIQVFFMTKELWRYATLFFYIIHDFDSVKTVHLFTVSHFPSYYVPKP